MNSGVEKRPPVPGKENEDGNENNCNKNKIYNFNPKCFDNTKLEDILSSFEAKKNKCYSNNYFETFSNENKKIISKKCWNNKLSPTDVDSFQYSILKLSNNSAFLEVENENTSYIQKEPLVSFEKLLECSDGIKSFRDFLESKDANFAKALDFYFAVKGFKILFNGSAENEKICSVEKLMTLVRLIYKRYLTGESKKLLNQQVRRSVTNNVKLLKKHILEVNTVQNSSFASTKDLSDKLNLPFSLANIFDEALQKTEQFLKNDLYLLFFNSKKHVNNNIDNNYYKNNNASNYGEKKSNVIFPVDFFCHDPSKQPETFQNVFEKDNEEDDANNEETSEKRGLPIVSKEPNLSFDKKLPDMDIISNASNATISEALRNNSSQNTIQTFYYAAPTSASDICNQQTPTKHQNAFKKLQEISSHMKSQPLDDYEAEILKNSPYNGQSSEKESLGTTSDSHKIFSQEKSQITPTLHPESTKNAPFHHNNSLVALNNHQQSVLQPSQSHSLSFLPNSALESEFESISSDAFTDDVTSLIDPSRQTFRHINKDLKNNRSKLLHGPPFIPRTHKETSNNSLATKNPTEFARILSSKLVLLQHKQLILETVSNDLLEKNSLIEESSSFDNKFINNSLLNDASYNKNIYSHNNNIFNSYNKNGDQIHKESNDMKHVSKSSNYRDPVKRLFDINNNYQLNNLPPSSFQSSIPGFYSNSSINHKEPTTICTTNLHTTGMSISHIGSHSCMEEAPQSILDKHISSMWDSFGNSPSLSPILFSPLSPSFSSDALSTLPTSFSIDPQNSRHNKDVQKLEKMTRLVDGLEAVAMNYEENYIQKSSYSFSTELDVPRSVDGMVSENTFNARPTSHKDVFLNNKIHTQNKLNKSNQNVLDGNSIKTISKTLSEFLSTTNCTSNDKTFTSSSVSHNIPTSNHSRPYTTTHNNIADKRSINMQESVINGSCDKTPDKPFDHHTSSALNNGKPFRNSQSAINFYNNNHNNLNSTTICTSSTTNSNPINNANTYHKSNLTCLCALKLKANNINNYSNDENNNTKIIDAKAHNNTNFNRNIPLQQSFNASTHTSIKNKNNNKPCNNTRNDYSNKRSKSGQHTSSLDGESLKNALDLSALKLNDKVLSWMHNSEEFNVLPTKECSFCYNNHNANNNNHIGKNKVHNTGNNAKKSGFKYLRNLAHSFKTTSILHN